MSECCPSIPGNMALFGLGEADSVLLQIVDRVVTAEENITYE